MRAYPKISVITPSFNQGQFLESTIKSVLGQFYPNLEYIIIDGGSSDESVEIIKKYERHLYYWVSEKDNGQSQAINKGFKISSGDILCWLNSDDLFMPNTLSFVANLVNLESENIYYGNCINFLEKDEVNSWGSNVICDAKICNLYDIDYFIQPATFWTRTVYERVGPLREDLHYTLDWEWFARAQKLGVKMTGVSKCLAMYRFHDLHKTGLGGEDRIKEIGHIYELYNQKNFELFNLIREEKIRLDDFSPNYLYKVLQTLNLNRSYGHILKILKPKKYSSFSVDSINTIHRVIS